MTRLGWSILILIVVVAAVFGSMLSFGTRPAEQGYKPTVVERVRERLEPRTGTPGWLTVPVAGYPRGALRDSWGDARGDGTRAHHGIDIMAARGAPVVSAANGRVEKLFESRLGGTTVYVRSSDRRWTYYYAHLAGYVAHLREGMRVRAGQQIGYVGDTGDAGPGNTHLHFGMTRMRRGERWWQGEDVNPYPILVGGATGG